MARPTDDPADVYLVVHGHFYQPPRENPWLDAVQKEPSAAPYPNWNARIADECYRTNAFARVFDRHGRVSQIINNYDYLSFNFGPTLLTWMERSVPDVYRRVLEADRTSAEARGGHGNAMAQPYGHTILPLCCRRDRLTLIRWGKRDFEARFGRPAEGMWLPETAVNAGTVEDLIAEGVRFIVLAPYQAFRVRPLGEDAWTEVRGGKVDPRMPYRLFSSQDPRAHIDVFFYDGPVSHAISFERVLDASSRFAGRLWEAVDRGREGPQLVNAAVDGETFGHHHRHAERALAWAFLEEVPARGFKLTNYGQYLDICPPTHEVELEPGPGGEGTAWSCAHGVGRWYRDCGCQAGAPEGWNQAWRTPLRRGIDLVRDETARVMDDEGAELLRDPWSARDDYVSLLIDRSEEARAAFVARHARGTLGLSRHLRILKLMEMQYHALMAQTSCGWFFNDISGLEATQVLRYAARAIQLMEELCGRNVEAELLEVLAGARSNLPEQGTGADVYQNHALGAVMDRRRLAAQYAITDLYRDHPADLAYFGHKVHRVDRRRFQSGHLTLVLGRVELEMARTAETADLIYLLLHFGSHDFHCAVRATPGTHELRRLLGKFDDMFETASVTELLRAVDATFGEAFFGLPSLLPEQREAVLAEQFAEQRERFAEMYTRLYMDNRRTVNALIDSGLRVPREFRMAAEYTLSRLLNEEVRRQRGSHDRARYERAEELVDEARHGGYELDLAESEALLGAELSAVTCGLTSMPSEQKCLDAIDLLTLGEALGLRLSLDEPQELVFGLVSDPERMRACEGFGALLVALLEKLGMSPELAGEATTGAPPGV